MSKTRYESGRTCEVSGVYEFDGYTDGTSTPAPTSEERRIPLSKGEPFPPVRSSNKAAWWKLISRA